MNAGPVADACALDASSALRAYAVGDISPVDVISAHISRINRLDGGLNAFVNLRADLAMAEARASEARWHRGAPVGPLDGVPVSVKDLMAVAGMPMTAGSARPWAVAVEDAEAVRRLRAAGAIVIGTNTLHEYAFGGTSVNAHVGTPRNPRDPSRIAGGSSGGSAAATAAGMAMAALGTETGNSIRRPASFCGVVGMKPTFGRVSRHGVVPLAPSLDHVGAFARTVPDVALVIAAISGHDPRDVGSRHQPVNGPVGPRATDGLTIGVPRSMLRGIDPAIGSAFERALRAFAAAGANVRDVDLPLASRWTALVSSIVMHAEAATVHRSRFTSDPGSYGADVAARLLSGHAFLGFGLVQALAMREAIGAEVSRALARNGGVDAFVAPGVPGPPPVIAPGAFVPGDAPWSSEVGPFHLQRLPSMLGLPAGAAPAGWSSDGLPLPIQAFGRHWEESIVLSVLMAGMESVPASEVRGIAGGAG